MEKANISDADMIRRLERTNQYFELTSDQESYLKDHGVSQRVVLAMRDIKPAESTARHASDRYDDTSGSERIGSRDSGGF